jgi:heme/copper-type cytochrome/quinol oxidase subunit 2
MVHIGMSDVGKLLIVLGAVLMVAGFALTLAGKMNWPLGKLPGDIVYRGKNTTIYFPIVSSVVVSVVISVVLYLMGRWKR